MYIDAYFRKGGESEIIKIVERINGKRVYKEYQPDYHFYINDANGTSKSIYGDTVRKMVPRTYVEKQKLLKSLSHNVKSWEADVEPIFRCLEQNYQHVEAPALNIAFFDIETSFDKDNGGWSEASEADNYITSISVHLQWLDEIICLAFPPETLTWDEASAIADEVGNVVLFKTEGEMLSAFMDVVEDADVLSGWNSEAYDIPYTVNRIKKVLGRHEARRLCLWEQEPKIREYDRGGKVQNTYDLIGRVHMDYLQLYKKYNYEERHSYKLSAISEIELGDNKIEYEGTLDELYNDDFKRFLEYNIQDTRLLDKLDKKLQFIDLANTIAHGNSVLLPTIMGAVAVTDQAVLLEAHSRNLVCPNKKRGEKEANAIRAAGGWVASPKKGFHKWIASTDMKSLYPSVIRSLNMSPETIVGQIRLTRTYDEIALWEAKGSKYTFASWWNDRFNVLEMDDFYNQDIGTKLILDMEDGQEFEVTGKELHSLIFDSNQPWCISANGTIFRTDIDGVIPGLLTRWYNERKVLQGIMTNYQDIEDNLKVTGTLVPSELFTNDDISDAENKSNPYLDVESYRPKKLKELISEGHKKRVIQYMNQHNLMVKEGKAIHRNQADLKRIIGFWDKRQLVKKINLNSAYGALLNVGSRFFDQRLGQSTTLSGRTITRHMASKTNEMITGVYDHYGDAIVYGDTDSCYFSAYPTLKEEIDRGEIEWTKDGIIEIYNDLAKAVSATFPEFLLQKLNVPIKRSTGVIASSRETVSESGIWMVKKRYACLMYDKDGIRLDVGGKPGKVKAMGVDLKRADTPKFVQEFLSEILLDALCDKGETVVIDKITDFKEKFEALKPWQQGTPRAVNKLSFYRDKLELHMLKKLKQEARGGVTVPGHVTASLAWNQLKEINRDQHAMSIIDGQKIIVCKLKETSENMLSSIAYPVDEVHLPDWFTNLPFDNDLMMAGIVDKKVQNLLGVLKWDFSRTKKEHAQFASLFDLSGM
jgi:DNA polymerase elongation subunit (family B)